jgi:hypothetical protein
MAGPMIGTSRQRSAFESQPPRDAALIGDQVCRHVQGDGLPCQVSGTLVQRGALKDAAQLRSGPSHLAVLVLVITHMGEIDHPENRS